MVSERNEENFHRFRGAMLLCYAAAAFVYALVTHVSYDRQQSLAALGVAFWTVGVMLTFCAAWMWFAARRRYA